MELRKIYGKWDTGIGKYWQRIETTGGKSLKRPRFTTDCRATKEEENIHVQTLFCYTFKIEVYVISMP
jgi:hypothetical protein